MYSCYRSVIYVYLSIPGAYTGISIQNKKTTLILTIKYYLDILPRSEAIAAQE